MSPDEKDEYSERLEQYLTENEKRGMVELLESLKGNEAAEIVDALAQSEGEQAVKILQYLSAHNQRGKLANPEYAVIGQLFVEWFNVEAKSLVEHELKKEFEHNDFS
jgi:Mg/Co/Ni transporter MgtE